MGEVIRGTFAGSHLTANSPRRTRRSEYISKTSVTAEPARADAGRALLAMLRSVAEQRDRTLRPWTGSWTGAPDNPSAASAVSAITRIICAARAHGAWGRTSHNPPVVGSSPTRPTSYARSSKNAAGQVCVPKTSTLHRAAPLRLIRASAVIRETLRASAKATYWAS
jgi:hypothetical protein